MIPSDLERRILEAKQKVSLLAFLLPRKKKNPKNYTAHCFAFLGKTTQACPLTFDLFLRNVAWQLVRQELLRI